LIYNDILNENFNYSLEQYVPGNKGVISYFWNSWQQLNFTWAPIERRTLRGNQVMTTYSKLYLMKKEFQFMDSVCGILHAVKRGDAELLYENIQGNSVLFKTVHHDDIRYNKMTYATFMVTVGIDRDGGMIPYQSTQIYVGQPYWNRFTYFELILIFLLVVIIIGVGSGCWYYRRKAKSTQARLDFELNDIRNVATVGYQADSVERVGLKSKRAQASMMEESNV